MTTIVERLVVEDDRIIMRGSLGPEVLLDIAYSGTPGIEQYKEQFELVKDGGNNNRHLAAEDYYQGLTVMTVIRRKSDGRLFGYSWWDDISKHGESSYGSNGDEHGFEWDDEVRFASQETADEDDEEDSDGANSVYVWLPVEPFTITGYRFPEDAADGGQES